VIIDSSNINMPGTAGTKAAIAIGKQAIVATGLVSFINDFIHLT
jgi:hypothetical protein